MRNHCAKGTKGKKAPGPVRCFPWPRPVRCFPWPASFPQGPPLPWAAEARSLGVCGPQGRTAAPAGERSPLRTSGYEQTRPQKPGPVTSWHAQCPSHGNITGTNATANPRHHAQGSRSRAAGPTCRPAPARCQAAAALGGDRWLPLGGVSGDCCQVAVTSVARSSKFSKIFMQIFQFLKAGD